MCRRKTSKRGARARAHTHTHNRETHTHTHTHTHYAATGNRQVDDTARRLGGRVVDCPERWQRWSHRCGRERVAQVESPDSEVTVPLIGLGPPSLTLCSLPNAVRPCATRAQALQPSSCPGLLVSTPRISEADHGHGDLVCHQNVVHLSGLMYLDIGYHQRTAFRRSLGFNLGFHVNQKM